MTHTVTPSPAGSPSLIVRTSDAATELTLRTPLARWLRLCLSSLLPALLVAVPVIAVLASGLPLPLRLVPILAIAVVVLALLFLALIAFANSLATARLIVDGQTLHLQPPGRRFSIPLRDIRRLDIDPSQPPYRLFSLCRPISLDIDTPAGRIRFFRSRTPTDLPPLLAALSPLLDLPPAPGLPAPDVAANGDANTPGGLLFLRGMIAVVLLFAVGFAYWEFIPAYQSRHWSATTGQITHSHWERIESTGPKKNVTYKIEVAYTYAVRFNTYAGDRVAFGRDNPDDAVRDYLQSHPAGSAATVYFDPRAPRQSTLIPGPGPLDWFLAATAGFLLLLTLPLLRRRSVSPDDLSLLARYRVHPHTTKDTVTLESVAAATADLPHWTTPPDEFERARRQRRRTYLVAAARTLVVLLVIEYAFYAYFSPRLPILFQSHTLLWLFLGMNVYALIPLAAVALPRGRPAEYRLTPDGIHTSAREHPLIRYTSLHSFTLSHDADPPHAPTIHLHTKDGQTRSLHPPADLAPRVISLIAEHLPQQAPPPRRRPLSRRDWLLGFAVMAVYTVVVGLVIRHNPSYLRAHDAGAGVQLAMLFLGPGTVAAPFLYRRRATAQLIPFAVTLNFVGTVTTMLYALLPRLLSALP